MRWLHAVLLALGALLFVILIESIGPTTLLADARRLGWGVGILILLEGIAELCRALGWRFCFPPGERPGLARIWGAHQAGAAINFITPTATLGGEVVRGGLVVGGALGPRVIAAVTVDRVASALSDVSIALLGLWVVLVGHELSAGAQLASVTGAGLLSIGVVSFWVIQRRGGFIEWVGSHPWIARLGGARIARRLASGAADVDARVAAFHARHPGSVAASIGLHSLASGIIAIQVAIFLTLAGIAASPGLVLEIFLVGMLFDVATFYVPARLGTQEGGRMIAMRIAGLEPALGLLLSLVIRVQQICWTAIGLAVYLAMAARRKRRADGD